MIQERGNKIRNLIKELEKEYIAYYHEAKQYGMSWEQINKPVEILDNLGMKFESLDRFILKQVKVDQAPQEQQEEEFKSRF